MAILRRVIDFVPDVGGLIPIPYNFDILAGDAGDRSMELASSTAARPLRARPVRAIRDEKTLDRAFSRSRSRSGSTCSELRDADPDGGAEVEPFRREQRSVAGGQAAQSPCSA